MHHHAVTLAEGVALRVQIHREGGDFVRHDGSRLLEALVVAAAQDVVGDHQLVPVHLGLGHARFGIDVDQLDDPVGVAP